MDQLYIARYAPKWLREKADNSEFAAISERTKEY